LRWGERLPEDQQQGATPFAPRCTKDAIEEALFDRRRDLLTNKTTAYGRATLGAKPFRRAPK